MLSFSELEADLRQLAEHYVGELDTWEFIREGRDYYMLVVPQDPYILADPYSYRAIDKMLDFVCSAYVQEFRWADYVASVTMETTELPYFCFKLGGYSL